MGMLSPEESWKNLLKLFDGVRIAWTCLGLTRKLLWTRKNDLTRSFSSQYPSVSDVRNTFFSQCTQISCRILSRYRISFSRTRILPSDEGLSRRVDEDIAGEEGKVRFRCPFEGYVLAVVEFVISQRHGVVACSVHKGDSRRALTQMN